VCDTKRCILLEMDTSNTKGGIGSAFSLFYEGGRATVTVKITILNGPGALRLEPRHKTAMRDALSSSQEDHVYHRLHLRLCDFSLRAHVSAAHRLRHFSSKTSRRRLARKPHLVHAHPHGRRALHTDHALTRLPSERLASSSSWQGSSPSYRSCRYSTGLRQTVSSS
jgi:hypothetical protein